MSEEPGEIDPWYRGLHLLRARRLRGALVLIVLLASLIAGMFAARLLGRIAAGLLLGGGALAIEYLVLELISRRSNRFEFSWFLAVGAVGTTGAAALAQWWLGPAAAVAAALAASSMQLCLACLLAVDRARWTRACELDARLAAGAADDEVEPFLRRAARWRSNSVFFVVDVLYRHRRLRRALTLLRHADVDDVELRSNWLVALHLELGETALARELVDRIEVRPDEREDIKLIRARVRIAEGDPLGVLRDFQVWLAGNPPLACVRRWAVRADAHATLGQHELARAELAHILEHAPDLLDRLARSGRPCHEDAQHVRARRNGKPYA